MNLEIEVANKILKNVEMKLNQGAVNKEVLNDFEGTKVFDMAKL